MPEVEGVEHRWADVNGFRMHYAEAGEGEPVILQHGWPQNWWAWRHVIGPLAERYRVIAPDFRGYGWSEAPRSGYEKAQLAADVIALMDEIGLDRVRYAGHDWGAYVGYLLGFDHPERLERMVTLSVGPPWRDGPPSPVILAMLSYQSVASSPLLGALAMRNGLPGRMLEAGRGSGEWTDSERECFTGPWELPGHDNAGVQTYRTFLTKELPAAIRGAHADRRLTVPTLLLMGGKDLIRKMLQPEVYERKADDFRTEIVDGVGHWLPDESPDVVTRRLLDFFAA
ncbi:MAG TPA: alpha/beta hydrolase [Thermoleophilaceae bacterium]